MTFSKEAVCKHVAPGDPAIKKSPAEYEAFVIIDLTVLTVEQHSLRLVLLGHRQHRRSLARLPAGI